MKTTWFTVATGSEQYVKMACLLSKNWTKHNNSELVVVTDSELPEKMGIPNLIYKKWKNYRHWGWYFKFEAYNQIINYNKADIYCFLDCDVMPVKKTDLSNIDKLSKYGCHIAMEEDMIGDGVAEWWGFKNPHLTNYMIKEIRKNHPEARQAWHGNGGFHFWHRDFLKKNRYYKRAHQIFEDLQKVKDATGSGFPCDEPVQQVMVQEIVKPKDIYHHTLESGVSKYIQETVFWDKIPEKPTNIDKTSYFTGKRKWSCEPSNIHLINGKKEFVRLSELEKYEITKKDKLDIFLDEDTIDRIYENSVQNLHSDALISTKTNITIFHSNAYELKIDKEKLNKFFEKIRIVPLSSECKIQEASTSVCMFLIDANKKDFSIIRNCLKSIKEGGVVVIYFYNKPSSENTLNTIPKGYFYSYSNSIFMYFKDVIKKIYSKNK